VETSQFEGKKVAMKQSKDGFIMSLAIHPDDLPEELMRDFVGSRYMVVMVRLGDTEEPMNRDEFAGAQMVKLAGMLCRDKQFWEFLHDKGDLFEKNEPACIDWITSFLGITSRADIKMNKDAQEALKTIYTEFKEWKN
jgi:hypothetical protein